ncbi:hypothetical protein [Leptospira harrisiae]|uniref:Uncharacterized protein n=1 Tax=Leptospira harrisiae TaxID=2023189 RepID=A0A2N0AJS3_9LEPT|nr:hypothetical protein [Leptospira harrisiae]PJZ84549.1 hypothetical protein CH364_11085 [Leptospira harrisiae]PKA07289.1 hypothetical protein CH366_12785 [Leptospira harrisiae]
MKQNKKFKIYLVFSISFIFTTQINADKNAFNFILKDSYFNYRNFVEYTDCNTQFDDSHPTSFELNKTFLTFYGDSLGPF